MIKAVKGIQFLIKGKMHNTVKDLLILTHFQASPNRKKCPKIVEICPVFPPPSWTKVNIDGCSRGNPGTAGCGGFFWNYRGFSKGSFTMPIGVDTTFVAEASAFIKAVHLALLKNWFPLWVETDSMTLCTKIKNMDLEVPWHMKAKWRRWLKSLEGKQFMVSHVYREGNQIADALANIGCMLDDFTWWFQYPTSVSRFVFRDLNGLSNFRFC